MVITKDKLIKRRGETGTEYACQLTPTTTPKGIGLTMVSKPIRGICKLEGDRLTLCLPPPGEAKRPKTFESPPGSDLGLFVLERVKD